MTQSTVRNVVLANDHGGFAVKENIIQVIQELGIEILDLGCDSEDIVRYPLYARTAAGAVARGEADRGILICSTGIGMSIAANKIRGIRASLCSCIHHARMTRLHNDSNVLCLGGKVTGIHVLEEIVRVWLTEGYMGGRHDISLNIISEQEKEYGLIVPERNQA